MRHRLRALDTQGASPGRVWLNGDLLPAEKARITVGDRGFTLGDGLFETMRAYGGRIFRLAQHIRRLERSAERIGLAPPDGLAAAAQETVLANALTEAAVRVTVSRGPAGFGLGAPGSVTPTCAITVWPVPALPTALRIGLASGRLNEYSPTAGLKRLGYLDQILALEEARRSGYDDALFLDTSGHLAEATGSNLFVLEHGALRTPPMECGVLPGITRATVLEIARELDVPTGEEPLAPAVLDAAEEVFLTSSLREIVPVVAVEGRRVGGDAPGPVTRRIQEAYAARVHSE